MSDFASCVQDAMGEGSVVRAHGQKAIDQWERVVQALRADGMDERMAQRAAADQVIAQIEVENAAKRHTQTVRLLNQRKLAEEVSKARAPDMTAQMTRVDMATRALERRFHGQIGEFFERFRTDLLSRVRNMDEMLDVVRASFGAPSGEAAKALAQAVNRTFEDMRLMANEAGANIGKMENYGWPTSHNQRSIRKAGRETWIAEIQPRLDWTKIQDPLTGLPIQRGDTPPRMEVQARFLNEVYDNIAFGKDSREAVYGRPAGDAAYKRMSFHRVLHFKTADDWIAYNKDFGAGDPFRGLVNHIKSMSKDIAEMREFGPNPMLGLEYKGQLWANRARTARDEGLLGKAISNAKQAQRMMRVLNGPGVPEAGWQEWAATFFATSRQALNAALLDRAVLAAPPDLANARMAAKMIGMNPNNVLSEFLGIARTLTKQERLRLGWIADTWAQPGATQSRFMDEVGAQDWAQKANNFSMRVQGLAAWTDRLKGMVYQEMSGHIADFADRPFADLPDGLRRHFENYDITANDWDRIRAEDAIFEAENGARFIAPVYWREATPLPRQDADDIFIKLQSAFEDVMEKSVPTRNLYVDGWTDPVAHGLTPGHPLYELMKSGLMFKRFIGSMTANMVGQWKARPTRTEKWAYLAEHVAIASVMGAAALQLKEIAYGRDPQDMTDPGFMFRAMIAGGGLAVLGDLLVTGSTSWGGGLASYTAGPVIQAVNDLTRLTVGNAAQAASQWLAGEEIDTNLVMETRNMLSRYALLQPPFLGPAVDRMIADQFAILLDPDALKAMQQAAQRRENLFGNGEFWRRGDFLPSRLPDFSGIFGG